MGYSKRQATNGRTPKGKASPFQKVRGSCKGQDVVVPVSWSAIDSAILHDAIIQVTDAGDALLFGLSQDQAVYAVTLYSSGDRKQFYTRKSDEMEEWLLDVVEAYKS